MALGGAAAALFGLVQAADAVFLPAAINYSEEYGLRRRIVNGRPEPVAVAQAWRADHARINCLIAHPQPHSDPLLHAWKPQTTRDALPGPQPPSGHARRLFLASVPPRWCRAMPPRRAAPAPPA